MNVAVGSAGSDQATITGLHGLWGVRHPEEERLMQPRGLGRH